MNLQIRKDDYNAIASLIQNELGYRDFDIEKFFGRMDLMKTDPLYTTFVTLISYEIVGFIGLHKGIAFELDEPYLRIIAMAVSKDLQNQGIGTALLQYAEDFAYEHGVKTFALNSGVKRIESHNFYAKNGFVKRSFGFAKNI